MTQTNSFGEFPTTGRPEEVRKTVYIAETGDGYEVVVADTRVAPDIPPYTLTDMTTGQKFDFETVLPLMLVNAGVSKPVVDNDVHSAESFGFNLSDPADAMKWVEITGEVSVVPIHPSLERRPGVDPDSEDYWNQLSETRGD